MENEEQQHQHQNHQNNHNNMNGRGQNGSSNNYSCDFWELGTNSWSNNNSYTNTSSEDKYNNNTSRTTATMFSNNPTSSHSQTQHLNLHTNLHPNLHYHNHQQLHHSLYTGGGSNLHPDPHLTCLKLGKRQYFEDVNNGGPTVMGDRHVSGFPMGLMKRGRSYDGVDVAVLGGGPSSSSLSSIGVGLIGSSTVVVPRCQVEGCHVALIHAKDYHRRHKVCEMHSKAPKVVVLGIEQRFCQQCSRFHVISEFDDSKRSCRRRLAGHNERRRKSSSSDATSSRNSSSQESRSTDGRISYISPTNGRVHSLLSSKSNSWVSPSDLSTRSSAALRELIDENRAAVLARQLFLDQNWHQQGMDHTNHNSQVEILSTVPLQNQFPGSSNWNRFQQSDAHVTLDLMQTPSPPFGFLSGRSKTKEEEEECCEIWKSLEGTHVV
ncbi:hypothetical protein C5167_049887 [Papaver somniferum]|uniref:SBP-type domain-containing protein n=1 Tax=Papaver somniferum TaxID=3469 RepID=A0A4Y7KQK7_PAPSO|nr:squamosa promoter-binding-like protein 7 [Papaver somniferum]RZC74411.1 hypothetical protein C5167_049887 [Papaver somniferum]